MTFHSPTRSLVNQDALKSISSIAGGLFPGMKQFQSETPFISKRFEILNKTHFSFKNGQTQQFKQTLFPNRFIF
ncbi:unnamed protein product [Brassica oleracea]